MPQRFLCNVKALNFNHAIMWTASSDLPSSFDKGLWCLLPDSMARCWKMINQWDGDQRVRGQDTINYHTKKKHHIISDEPEKHNHIIMYQGAYNGDRCRCAGLKTPTGTVQWIGLDIICLWILVGSFRPQQRKQWAAPLKKVSRTMINFGIWMPAQAMWVVAHVSLEIHWFVNYFFNLSITVQKNQTLSCEAALRTILATKDDIIWLLYLYVSPRRINWIPFLQSFVEQMAISYCYLRLTMLILKKFFFLFAVDGFLLLLIGTAMYNQLFDFSWLCSGMDLAPTYPEVNIIQYRWHRYNLQPNKMQNRKRAWWIFLLESLIFYILSRKFWYS